jgi:hypothetical protein
MAKMIKNPETNSGPFTNSPTTGMDGSGDIAAGGDDNDDKNMIKVPNRILTEIVNEVPK